MLAVWGTGNQAVWTTLDEMATASSPTDANLHVFTVRSQPQRHERTHCGLRLVQPVQRLAVERRSRYHYRHGTSTGLPALHIAPGA